MLPHERGRALEKDSRLIGDEARGEKVGVPGFDDLVQSREKPRQLLRRVGSQNALFTF